jgi:hypothetical protein
LSDVPLDEVGTVEPLFIVNEPVPPVMAIGEVVVAVAELLPAVNANATLPVPVTMLPYWSTAWIVNVYVVEAVKVPLTIWLPPLDGVKVAAPGVRPVPAVTAVT